MDFANFVRRKGQMGQNESTPWLPGGGHGGNRLKSVQVILQGFAEDLRRADGVFALLQVGNQLGIGVRTEAHQVFLVGFCLPALLDLCAGGGLAVGY